MKRSADIIVVTGSPRRGMRTDFIVQPYKQSSRQLAAMAARPAKSEEDAVRIASQLSRHAAAVVAFAVTYDPDVELETEPRILFRSGPVPGLDHAA